ncbi:MAG: geranyl transferase, partial [Gammaproteobacteria bacterium]
LTNDDSLSPEVRITLLQALTHAAFKMAEGQSIDLSVVEKSIDINTLKDMHQKKTGALLSCSVNLGALISEKCTKEDRQILNQFSKDIGLAYQIQDDVLDVLTPDFKLGKRQNSDVDKNKPTYPALLGLENSKREYEDLYKKAFSALNSLSVDASQLQQLTQQLQSRSF